MLHTSYVILGRLFNLSEAVFLICKMGILTVVNKLLANQSLLISKKKKGNIEFRILKKSYLAVKLAVLPNSFFFDLPPLPLNYLVLFPLKIFTLTNVT